LLYWTAWVTEDGEVQFREDIYDYDATLQAALIELQAPPLRILPPELLTLR
jgi:murein L,D-transpeptidase YcbB/YkuD